MDALVGRILDLARIESTKPLREAIDLAAFLEATAERYRRRGHEVAIAFDGARPISAAPDQLESLVSNLIDNAIRHGKGRPVEVSARDDGITKVITVRDHGPTLEPSALDRAFERFYTTTRNEGGTGLGLAIVKAVAEAHGGSVSANVEDEGASFTVRIPL
jgi:signal transduction histidine kinase